MSADKLAKNVAVSYDGVTGIFSDNYFDLLPGQTHEIRLRTGDAPEKVLAGLSCMTLDRSYE